MSDRTAIREFPELKALMKCIEEVGVHGRVVVEHRVRFGTDRKEREFPLLSFHFGPDDETKPVLVFVAGVHGLEKIGTQIVSSYLRSWLRLITWDKTLKSVLDECRVLFYPLVNPVGMHRNRRSNGRGIDLMRNAPVEAETSGLPLVRGHRLSPLLPWYRGAADAEMEPEAKTLADFIRRHCFKARYALTLDVHSGFGLVDRLWFPFAYSPRYFPEAPEVLAIKRLFDQSYPHHSYVVEPQHHAYTTNGDLWDYLYLEHHAAGGDGTFLPLSLEMGSWTWVRKNPRQIFSSLGLFNPVLPHRVKRAERRHFLLFNFLVKAIASADQWGELDAVKRRFLEQKAKDLWYQSPSGTE